MSENHTAVTGEQNVNKEWVWSEFKKATMVAHFICALFSGFVIYNAWPGSSKLEKSFGKEKRPIYDYALINAGSNPQGHTTCRLFFRLEYLVQLIKPWAC